MLLLLSGALLEEAMFRGYPFQRLVEAVGPVWAVVALSALFGAAHLGNPNASGVLSWAFLNTIAIGVLLALAYLRTRTLWLPFGIHFGWNFALGFVFGLPVSGMNTFRRDRTRLDSRSGVADRRGIWPGKQRRGGHPAVAEPACGADSTDGRRVSFRPKIVNREEKRPIEKLSFS